MPLDQVDVAATQGVVAAAAVDAPRPGIDPRTRRLLEGPIAATLLRMAWPNMLVMLVQAALGLVETYFVGRLGTAALAGMALAFPPVMLMQMMSAGAIGGGISSAVARALGGGRRADADRLAVHALLIAAGFGAGFSVAMLLGGRALYAAMGGAGPSLQAALTYSNVVFGGGMVLIWVFNALANVIRGTGNMMLPALVSVSLTIVLVPLSPCLIFGWGPFPRLGIAGGATALIVYYAIGTVLLAAYLASGRSVVRLSLRGFPLERRLFADILRVGAVAALITVGTNLTVAITTGLVGAFGPEAIAGYGVGSRLEYLLVPLVFGLGSPLVAMVGTNIGAGRRERALRAAWIGAGIAVVLTETIGLAAAAFPSMWLTLFDDNPLMLAVGTHYLHTVAPCYGLFGLGMALYFASQGAGRLRWPLIANVTRLTVATCGGYLALTLSGDLTYVFIGLSLALAVFGLTNAGAVAAGAWFKG